MAKDRRAPRPDAKHYPPPAPGEVPDSLRGETGTWENVGLEDFGWSGVDFQLSDEDQTRLVNEILGAHASLELVVRAIVRLLADQERPRTDVERVKEAMSAFLPRRPSNGIAGERREIRRINENTEIYEEIARQYRHDFLGLNDRRRSLTELCECALEKVKPEYKAKKADPGAFEEYHGKVRTLRTAFWENRDYWMFRVVGDAYRIVETRERAADNIIRSLPQLLSHPDISAFDPLADELLADSGTEFCLFRGLAG